MTTPETIKYNDHSIRPSWLYTVLQVAEILDSSESTVKRKLKARKITYTKDGSYKVKGSDLIAYIDKITVKTLF